MRFWLMTAWLRELAGWGLVGLGLVVFALCIWALDGGALIEAGIGTSIGFIVFRGGIHVLKVAVAARVCLQAQERLADQQSVSGAAAPPARRKGPLTWSKRL